jgi:GTPase SAR1 family protein
MADAYKYFDDLDYNDHSDYVVKFVLIGEAGSGKSSIMAKFIEDVFSSDYVGTIGELIYHVFV